MLPENIMIYNVSISLLWYFTSIQFTSQLKQCSLCGNFTVLCPQPCFQVHAGEETLGSYVLCIGMTH